MKRMSALLLVCFVLACACFFAACDGTASLVSDRARVSSGLNSYAVSSDPNAATPDDYFRFNLLGDGTYEILARYHDMPNRLIIPSAYNEKAISGIGDVFGGNTENDCLNRSVEEIVLPNSISKIGDFAFYYYVSLRSVMLPSSVQTIGRMAFAGCCELQSITIPDGVRSLDESFLGARNWFRLRSRIVWNPSIIRRLVIVRVCLRSRLKERKRNGTRSRNQRIGTDIAASTSSIVLMAISQRDKVFGFAEKPFFVGG